MSTKTRLVVFWAESAIWAFIILVLFIMPRGTYAEIDIRHFDKVIHALFFLVLGFLLYRSLRVTLLGGFPLKEALFTLILCAGYGILLELVQGRIPGRHADPMDAAADILGAILGIIAAKGIKWR